MMLVPIRMPTIDTVVDTYRPCVQIVAVAVDGKNDYMFGWHGSATDPMYIGFLEEYIRAVSYYLA